MTAADDLVLPGPGEPGCLLPVEGTLNFRDIGGYPTADGRRLRTGVVFRSDQLSAVTDAGFAVLASYGLRTVVDLRMPAERERQPSRLPGGVDVVLGHDSAADEAAHLEVMEEIKAGRITTVTEDDVAVMYTDMLRDATFMFSTVLREVARVDRRPVLFHCTAGKDRTGMSAAIIHRLCGVPEASVELDYVLTNPYRAETRFAQLSAELGPLGIDAELIRPLIGAPLGAFRTAMRWIDDNGGVEAYVTDHLGVDAATVAGLRAALVG